MITTAAGLVIAIPAIAVYYVIKDRLMRAASLIEVALENLITSLYLKKESAPEAPAALGQGRAQSPRNPQPERADDGRREAPDVAT